MAPHGIHADETSKHGAGEVWCPDLSGDAAPPMGSPLSVSERRYGHRVTVRDDKPF